MQIFEELQARGLLAQLTDEAEIRELINSGAEVIFLTPVEWDHASEGIEAARAAGVKIIVVDTFVSNPESVTCSVVSDNYQAGVLCS